MGRASQQGGLLKIAVMVDEGNLVSYHFGRAPLIAIVECDSEIKLLKVVRNPHGEQTGGGRRILDLLRAENVEAVITGSIGPGAFEHLSSAGIKIYKSSRRRLEDAVSALMRGELEEISEPHRSHHHT